MAWIINYSTMIELSVDVVGVEQVALSFDTLDAYHFRYNYTFPVLVV